jgi:hypothetical protein
MRLAWLLLVLCACRGETVKHVAGEARRVGRVHHADMVDRVLLTGELRAAFAAEMIVPRTDSWQIPIRWMAQDGASVKAGERVLEFDNSSFVKQLEQQRLAVIDAETTLRTAADLSAIDTASKANELRQHQIALAKASVRADVPQDVLTTREWQDRQLEKKRAEVAVQKAEQDFAAQKQAAALDLEVKRIALDKAKRALASAESSIDELVVHAPRDGDIVIKDHPWLGRKFRIGDTVQPGMVILAIPDLRQPMEVGADLADVDDGRIAVGMTGTCALDAYPRDPIPCTVRDLTPVARNKGEESLRRAFAVVLTLGKSDPATMRPGMSVKVELHRQPLANALVVPRGAIVFDDKTTHVRMANGELREVTIGACDPQQCVVDHGVADGDAVLLGGGT